MPDINEIILGKWRIIESKGHGKHGAVYKAQNIIDNTIAAVKIISLPNDEMKEYVYDEYGSDHAMIDNFMGIVAQKFGNEVNSMAKLDDVPYVIKLYDNLSNQTEWTDRNGKKQRGYDLILVMEYANPLKDYYEKRPLRIRDVINFASDIALGLIECEKRNIIHRDIKEDNLFIGIDDGIGKIGDFGISSINETGMGSTVGMGTPYYMAPEVANIQGMNDGNYDNTVDIYSLGIVLFKMLNGNKFPFVKDGITSAQNAMKLRLSGTPMPLPQYANKDLGSIVIKCCEFLPQNRFLSGAALYRALTTVKNSMSEQELDKEIPYRYNGQKEPKIDYIPIQKAYTHKENKVKAREKNNFLKNTMDILADMSGTVAAVFRGVLREVSSKQQDEIVQQYKRRHRRNGIILVSIIAIALLSVLVMLYPKTATFYIDPSDNGRIHVKYLFFPDMRKADVAASYLNVDGNWLYYSNPEEDHAMYRLSIWFGEPELLCEDDCEYDIVIGDYVYYTSFDEGEKLCRIKKDGTGKEYILNYACRDLRRNGNNIMFVLADTGELKELDTSTIN